MSQYKNSRRILPLDTLRGFAILLVLVSHFFYQRIWGGEVGKLVYTFGDGGVLLFFLLSGYLIFKNLQTHSLYVFLHRRFFKLFPAYWVNVIVIAVLGQIVSDYPKFPLLSYVTSFFMVSDLFHQEGINGVYWTLFIEIKFYLLIALQHRFLGNRFVLLAPLLSLLGNIIVLMTTGKSSALLTFLPVFYVGVEIYRAEQDDWKTRALLRLFAVTAIVAVSMLWSAPVGVVDKALYIIFDAVLFVVFLRFAWHFEFFSFYGRISYSLYLYHTAIGFALFKLWAKSGMFSSEIQVILAILITTILAGMSYLWIENGGILIGKKLER